MTDRIAYVGATEVLGPHGYPTIETVVATERGFEGRAVVPWGMSVGKYECKKIYDGGKRYRGRGVRTAVQNVNELISPALRGVDVSRLGDIDRIMLELDGTPDKSKLGGNAILSVSMAAAKAGAKALGLPLYRFLGGLGANRLPVLISNMVGGGTFYNPKLVFEDYLVMAYDFDSTAEAVEALSEVYLALGEALDGFEKDVPMHKGLYVPQTLNNEQVFEALVKAAEIAGFGGRMRIALDVCAGQFYDENKSRYAVEGTSYTREEFVDYLAALRAKYPIAFIEDPLHEDDFEGFALACRSIENTVICGDDLFATSVDRLEEGIRLGAANSLLLKVDQVGTVSEACAAAEYAHRNGYTVTVSMRSRDTADTFIADLAVAVGAEYFKLGAPVMAERTEKLNRFCAIERELGPVPEFWRVRK